MKALKAITIADTDVKADEDCVEPGFQQKSTLTTG